MDHIPIWLVSDVSMLYHLFVVDVAMQDCGAAGSLRCSMLWLPCAPSCKLDACHGFANLTGAACICVGPDIHWGKFCVRFICDY